jgi:hypothetical protein
MGSRAKVFSGGGQPVFLKLSLFELYLHTANLLNFFYAQCRGYSTNMPAAPSGCGNGS